MGKESVDFENVSFTHETLSGSLINALSVTFTAGGTVIVGANRVGKSTILKLAAGILSPTGGMIHGSDAGFRVVCEKEHIAIRENPDGTKRAFTKNWGLLRPPRYSKPGIQDSSLSFYRRVEPLQPALFTDTSR